MARNTEGESKSKNSNGCRCAHDRREILAGVAVTGLTGLAGCLGGSDDGQGNGGSSGNGGNGNGGSSGNGGGNGGSSGNGGGGSTSSGSCSPGYDEESGACKQLKNAAKSMRSVDVAGTAVPVQYDIPCGWTADPTDQFDEHFLVNVGPGRIGTETVEDGGYNKSYSLQLRFLYEPPAEGFLDEQRHENTEDVEFEYDGETRTAVVASNEYGTSVFATIPFDGSRMRIDFSPDAYVGEGCSTDPFPDYEAVISILQSFEPNPDTTFELGMPTPTVTTTA